MTSKYPDIKVKLLGQDGNAFMIIGRVRQALAKANVSLKERDAFTEEAMSGDYAHVLATVAEWVEIS